MRWIFTLLFLLALIGANTVLVGQAFAQPVAAHRHVAPTTQVNVRAHVRMAKGQQNQAREAYKRGEIQSLAIIRRNVITTYQGRIISTKFVEHRSSSVPFIYTFRVLGKDGKVMVVQVDARNAKIIQVRGKR